MNYLHKIRETLQRYGTILSTECFFILPRVSLALNSSLPNACSTENNIPFPLSYSHGNESTVMKS